MSPMVAVVILTGDGAAVTVMVVVTAEVAPAASVAVKVMLPLTAAAVGIPLINKLIDDRELGISFGAYNKMKSRKYYSYSVVIKRLTDCYEQL